MLLFIAEIVLIRSPPSSFQYISCYCLSVRWSHNSLLIAISIHLMLLFISPSVTSTRASTLFQYISCYCLSIDNKQIIKDNFVFQYISCYCLSEMFETIEVPNSNFNTSHVTVYRFCLWKRSRRCKISIHLMLLFIGQWKK